MPTAVMTGRVACVFEQCAGEHRLDDHRFGRREAPAAPGTESD